MKIVASAPQKGDSSIIRSREFLLFGQGLATLWLEIDDYSNIKYGEGYYMIFSEEVDERGVKFWRIDSDVDQTPAAPAWQLRVSQIPPRTDDNKYIKQLVSCPGQYIFLSCLPSV